MQEVLTKLRETRDKCERLGPELAREFNIATTDDPINAFTLCFNTTTVTLETCDYYSARFAGQKATAADSLEIARRQNGERIVMQTKMHFLFALSAMEHCAREAADKHQSVLELDPTKWRYLSRIMRKSKAVGIIDAPTHELWSGLIQLRNALVHNNGIASEDLERAYPDGTTITMRGGAMTEGNLLTFAALTDWAVETYAHWCRAFMKAAGY